MEWKDANELSKYFYSKTKSESIDSYYFEEFFTAIYNAQFDDRPIRDIFLFLPSRKVKQISFHSRTKLYFGFFSNRFIQIII